MADERGRERQTGPGHKHQPNPASSAMAVAGHGIELVVFILVFLYVGQWLDKKLGTSPLLLIAGVFVGAGIGFYSMYRALVPKRRDPREPPSGGR